jgi:hypothetical protein
MGCMSWLLKQRQSSITNPHLANRGIGVCPMNLNGAAGGLTELCHDFVQVAGFAWLFR